jgi:hypothetical protein
MVKDFIGYEDKETEEPRPMEPDELEAWAASINRR